MTRGEDQPQGVFREWPRRAACLIALVCLMLSTGPGAGAATPLTLGGPGSARIEKDARVLFLLTEAQDRLTAGQRDSALQLGQEAVRLAPDHPGPYLFLMRASLPKEVFAAAVYFGQAAGATFRNFGWFLSLTGGLLTLFLAAVSGSLLLGWFVLVFRSVPPLAHDIREKNVDWKWLIPSLIAAGLGMFYPVFFLSFLLWPYFLRKDKGFLVALPVLLVLSPWLLSVVAANFSLPSSPQVKAALLVRQDSSALYALDVLGPAAPSPEEQFTRAQALARQGDLRGALAGYGSVPASWRHYGRVLNNLGVVHYRLHHRKTATEYFEKALDSGLASVKFNLSQAYRDALRFDEGERIFKQVQTEAPEAVSRFMNSKEIVVTESLPAAAVWSLVRRDGSTLRRFQSALWKPIMGQLPLTFGPVAGAVVFLLFWLRKFLPKRKAVAYRCTKCGVVHCGRCENRLAKSALCNSCYLGSRRIDQADPQQRVRRILKTQRYFDDRVRLAKLLALIPGFGSFYMGRWWTGAVLCSLFIMTAGMMFFSDLLFWVPSIFFQGADFALAGIVVLPVLIATSYLMVRKGVARGWH